MHLTRTLAVTLSVVTAWLSGCGISEEIYNRDVDMWKAKSAEFEAKSVELEAARAALEAADADKAKALLAMTEEKALCVTELEKVSSQKGQVASSLSEALTQLNKMKAIAAKQKAMLSGLLSSLDGMVSAGTVKVVRRNGRLVVQVSENILFDTGKSKLKDEGTATLAQIAPVLAKVNREFQVSGHTDNVGGAEVNWKLSIDRAFTVLNTLIEAGYPSERLSASGYAWHQPVADNDTDEGRSLNRRVDLVLVPNLDELKLPSVSEAPSCHQLARVW